MDPLVSRILKGPSSTDKVFSHLDFLKSLGLNDELTLEQLTRKLLVLLALMMVHRADLVTLSLTRRMYTPEGVVLTCSGLAKTTKPGKEKDLQSVINTSLGEAVLCPAMELVKLQLRNLDSQQFLATVMPHGPATSSTVL